MTDFDHQDLEEQIRLTAYFLWEQDGRPEGRAWEYWLRARDRHRRQTEFDEMLTEAPPAEQQQQG